MASTGSGRWNRRESKVSESMLQEMIGTKRKSAKTLVDDADDEGSNRSARGDGLEMGSDGGGDRITAKNSDKGDNASSAHAAAAAAAAPGPLGSPRVEELTVRGQRSPIYLLWLVGGVSLGLLCIYVAFGSVTFGDPLDPTNPRQWYCAMMCAIVWSGLATACYLSLVHELLVKRRLYADLELPTIPHLALHYLLTPVVGGGLLFAVWVALYQSGTLVPFHGAISAVCSLVGGPLYLYATMLPKDFYHERPALPRIVLLGTLGLIAGGVLIPIIVYWIVLVFYQLAAKSGGLGSQIVVLLLFQATKVGLIHYEIWVFRAVLGPVAADSLSDMLAISIVSILHNSFFSVAVESSNGYVAVAVSVIGNFMYATHRTLVLNFNVDFVKYLNVVILSPTWRKLRHAYFTAIGKSGNAALLRTRAVAVAAAAAASGGGGSVSSDSGGAVVDPEAALALDEANRAYLVLQFLSWEVYKFIVPLMYLAGVYIIMSTPNRVWLAGLGRTTFQYNHDLNDTSKLVDLTQKLLVLTGCDLFILIVEILFLRRLGIDLPGVLCFTCKQVGLPMALMLAFLPLHNICIISIPCGMDFTFAFKWLSYGKHFFTDVDIVSA